MHTVLAVNEHWVRIAHVVVDKVALHEEILAQLPPSHLLISVHSSDHFLLVRPGPNLVRPSRLPEVLDAIPPKVSRRPDHRHPSPGFFQVDKDVNKHARNLRVEKSHGLMKGL